MLILKNLSLKKIENIISNKKIIIDNGGLSYNKLYNVKNPIYIQYNNFEDFLKDLKKGIQLI
jgi:hypothetical protein